MSGPVSQTWGQVPRPGRKSARSGSGNLPGGGPGSRPGGQVFGLFRDPGQVGGAWRQKPEGSGDFFGTVAKKLGVGKKFSGLDQIFRDRGEKVEVVGKSFGMSRPRFGSISKKQKSKDGKIVINHQINVKVSTC